MPKQRERNAAVYALLLRWLMVTMTRLSNLLRVGAYGKRRRDRDLGRNEPLDTERLIWGDMGNLRGMNHIFHFEH